MNSPRISQQTDASKLEPTLKPQRIVCAGEAFNAEQRFSQMPDWVAALPISGNAKIIYARLLRYAQKSGRAYPSYATLGEYVGLSERQAQRLCHELRDAGLINILRRRESKSKRNLPSVFEFIYRPEMDAAPADPRPGDLEKDPTDIHVGRSQPADEHGAEPTDICGAEPVDIGVRVREKVLRDKGKREKHTPQQQQQLSAHQHEPAQPAVAAALNRDFSFTKTLQTLKQRFPTIKATHEWAKICEESGLSDATIERFIDDAGGVWAFRPDLTAPTRVVGEAIAAINLQRSWLEEAHADQFLEDRRRGVVYPNFHGKANPCKCGEFGLIAVDGEPRCSTCNALRDDLPQSDKWRVLERCENCGHDAWQPLSENDAVCSRCMHYRPVDSREIVERLFRTVKLFAPDDLGGAWSCSDCGSELALKFETGVAECARCSADDLQRFNPELAAKLARECEAVHA